ncbi:MAG: NADH-quinone oxidoreductase subunit H, partial [Actinobacteria bacterium]|nr:NADH-quinone oxidoreductase subunit H [Actinomycetota bacterium]
MNATGDPLFAGGVDWVVVAFVVVKALIGFTIVMVGVIFMIWFERKVIADMQNRIGPNRAGRWGLAQTLADGIKLIFKEDLRPDKADSPVFRLAPYLSVAPAFLTFTIVPIGGVFTGGNDGAVELFGRRTWLQVADPPVGVLFLLAMSSIAVYGIMLAGWSSGSKYPLLGSVRASAQMVSYEAALGLSVVAVVLLSGSLSTHDIVAAQAGSILNWNVIATAGVPFAIFCVAATAELNRPPFDMPIADSEIIFGHMTEYTGIKYAFFMLAEYAGMVVLSAIATVLFLGGWYALPGVTVLDVDAIRQATDTGVTGAEAVKARALVEEAAERFAAWRRAVRVDPTIAALRSRAEAVRAADGSRILSSQLAEQDPPNVTGMLDFEVRRDDWAAVEAALREAGQVVSRNVARSADTENTVDTKIGGARGRGDASAARFGDDAPGGRRRARPPCRAARGARRFTGADPPVAAQRAPRERRRHRDARL